MHSILPVADKIGSRNPLRGKTTHVTLGAWASCGNKEFLNLKGCWLCNPERLQPLTFS